MQLSVFQRHLVAVCLSATIVLLAARFGMAQAATEATEEVATEAPAKEEAADPFAVPEGNAEQLLEFMTSLRQMRPQITSYAEFMEHRKKVAAATIEAAEKILQGEATDAQTVTAIQAKLEMLNELTRVPGSEAAKQLEAFLESLGKDNRPAIRRLVQQFSLMQQTTQWGELDDAKKKALIADVLAFAKQGPADMDGLRLVMGLGQAAERSDSKAFAAELFGKAAPIFTQSEDKRIAGYGAKMHGMARRMTLVGNTMEIKGALLGGKPFDWSAYRGKVVLVDFWATWCGPCIAELPNVKENYGRYHEKGFDVIGISLDTDKDRLVKFVDKEEIPWPILFSEDEATQGWDHPMATYYGIMGIPAAILVDQQGKVVTLSARGADLTRRLEQLLGKIEAPADAEEVSTETRGG